MTFKESALKELQFERDVRLQEELLNYDSIEEMEEDWGFSESILKEKSDNELMELIDSTMNDVEWKSLLKITRESFKDTPVTEFEIKYHLLWETICSKLQNFN
jgi:hypothetical protein